MNTFISFISSVHNMYEIEELDIQGYKGSNIPNSLHKLNSISRDLAIIYPGLGYTSKMPLLFYMTFSLLEQGVDVLTVDTNYSRLSGFLDASREERLDWFYQDVEAVFDSGVSKGYRCKVLVGKSLGTMALAHLLTKKPSTREMKLYWLTPLIKDDIVRSKIIEQSHLSLVVIGTKDHHYDEDIMSRLTPDVRCVILEGVNHGLLIDGDTLGSLTAMQETIRAIQEFGI